MTAAEVERRGASRDDRVSDGRVMVRVDVARLKQVFSNIIHNAARYTSESDEIVVRSRHRRRK